MKVRFLGAVDGHVTGSCTHFSYTRQSIQFLVDCGMVQGEGNDLAVNSAPFPFTPSEIDFVFLTHAHQDHCGLIPKLYREGFVGRVICTRATALLARASLLNSARQQDSFFTESDVKRIKFEHIDEREDFGLSRLIPVADDLFVGFTRSAHILGACSIVISWLDDENKKKNIVMSGDLGNNTKENQYQPLLAGRQGIFFEPGAVVVESTYGARTREKYYSDFDARINTLRDIVQHEVFDKKSVLVIPAFSLQRTQEILFDLYCVFKKYFSTEEQSQSTYFPICEHYNEFENGCWSGLLNSGLMRAIDEICPEEKSIWGGAVVKSEENVELKFSLKEGSELTVDQIKEIIGINHTYPVDIVLDSPLGLEMTGIFGRELCRRQNKKQDETLYRNRKMNERLGLNDENEVDEFLQKLFPQLAGEESDIRIGEHSIRFLPGFTVPKTYETYKRGCIVITGGGMCDGGPVLEHLSKLATWKRPSTLLETGYMAKGSLGEKFVSSIKNKTSKKGGVLSEKISIKGSMIDPGEIRINLAEMQGYYSGHADQDGLLDFIFQDVRGKPTDEGGQAPVVFLNHGQHIARKELKKAIEKRSEEKREGDRSISHVECPDHKMRWYDLNENTWLDPEVESKTDILLKELLKEQRKTNQLLQNLIDIHTARPNYSTDRAAKNRKK